MWYASTCLNSWAKLFRTYCSTSLGIASLLTALDVSRLANLEANLEALAICSCTFDIFWKATWLLCSPIFHLKWHCAWKCHFSRYIDSVHCYRVSFKLLPFSHMTESWPSFSDDLVSWLGGGLGCNSSHHPTLCLYCNRYQYLNHFASYTRKSKMAKGYSL